MPYTMRHQAASGHHPPRPLFVVDAFADGPFTGNPAAVVLLDEDDHVDDRWMQNVAGELSLSETAFVRLDDAKRGGKFGLRWFTPEAEVALCGHATLASAHVLYDAAKVNLHTPVVFSTQSGDLRAAPVDGGIRLDFPETPPEHEEIPGLAEIIGTEPAFTGRSRFDLFAELPGESLVRAAAPDLVRLAALEARGLILTSRADDASDCDVVSRCFYPSIGIDEDPVTGSAHCAIGPYWARKLNKAELECRQVSRRGGRLRVTMDPATDRVHLTGRAFVTARGELVV